MQCTILEFGLWLLAEHVSSSHPLDYIMGLRAMIGLENLDFEFKREVFCFGETPFLIWHT